MKILLATTILVLQVLLANTVYAQSSSFTNESSDVFLGTLNADSKRLAWIVSKRNPSTETYDFDEERKFCEPNTNFNSRIKWRNGSCVDTNTGLEIRFIETVSDNGDLIYFRCDAASGVSIRSLMSRYVRSPLAEFSPDETEMDVKTRVVVNGRDVGTFDGKLPNLFVTSSIEAITTNDDRSLFERIRAGDGGRLKLETFHGSSSRDGKFLISLNGFRRAIDWCVNN